MGRFPSRVASFLPTADYDIPSMVRGKDLQQISWITDQILAMAPVLSSRFLTWHKVDVFSEQHARYSPTDFGNGSPESFKISACRCVCRHFLLSRCSCMVESAFSDSLKRNFHPQRGRHSRTDLRSSLLLWTLFFHNDSQRRVSEGILRNRILSTLVDHQHLPKEEFLLSVYWSLLIDGLCPQ